MISTADAVVIGGGILGASTAHFLAKTGYGNVLLIDKGRAGYGSTFYSAGHVRQHYSNEVTIRLAVRALEMFTNDREELGGPTDFIRTGYLVVAAPGQEEAIRLVVPMQQSFGVETSVVTGADVSAMFPDIDGSDIAVGAWEPESGYANPLQTVLSLVRSAREQWGLVLCEGVEVLDVIIDGDAVKGIVTSHGDVSTPVVVNCAGPWAPGLAAKIGLDYQFALSREHEVIFALPDGVGPIPVFSDAINLSYFRPAGNGRMLVGEGYPKDQEPVDPDAYDDGTDVETARRLAQRVSARIPALRETLSREDFGGSFLKGYSGVYDITPDWNPIVGPVEGLDGYYSACGGSGHCFKIGPPIGEALAEVIAGREPRVDLSPLGQQRFETTELLGSVWGPGNRA